MYNGGMNDIPVALGTSDTLFHSMPSLQLVLNWDGSETDVDVEDGTSEKHPNHDARHGCPVKLRTRSDGVRTNAIWVKQLPEGLYPSLQYNAACAKTQNHKILKSVIIMVNINGHECRALFDSGSLRDFMSTILAEQLKVKKVALELQITVQLAAQGSKTKVNYSTTVDLLYANIHCERTFDIMNINEYNLIFGTPFIWQHKSCLA
jgi:hypothetical protein